jgi:hypothetical protein
VTGSATDADEKFSASSVPAVVAKDGTAKLISFKVCLDQSFNLWAKLAYRTDIAVINLAPSTLSATRTLGTVSAVDFEPSRFSLANALQRPKQDRDNSARKTFKKILIALDHNPVFSQDASSLRRFG